MVLTITVVGNGSDQGSMVNNGTNGQTLLSPNDLAQLMSGQTVTGILNPDGSITLNSNVLTSTQSVSDNSISTTKNMNNQSSDTISSSSPSSSNISNPYQLSVSQTGVITSSQLHHHPSSALNGIQAEQIPSTNAITSNSNVILSTGSLNNNTYNNMNMNNNNHSINTTNNPTYKKNGGQKKLTAKQKQQQKLLLQQQQSSQLMKQPQQLINTRNSSSTFTTDNINNNQGIDYNNQQPQIVATVQLPNGQIGQLIAPSGSQFWSPNAINLQQLSMAVAAAIPQSMPTISTTNGPSSSTSTNSSAQVSSSTSSNLISNDQNIRMQQQQDHHNNQEQEQQQQQSLLSMNEMDQTDTQGSSNVLSLNNNNNNSIINRTCQSSQVWSGRSINLSQLSALAQHGVVQMATPIQSSVSSNGSQRVIEVVPQNAIQGLLSQNGQSVQSITLSNGCQSFITQDPNDPSKWNLVQPSQFSNNNSQQLHQMTTNRSEDDCNNSATNTNSTDNNHNDLSTSIMQTTNHLDQLMSTTTTNATQSNLDLNHFVCGTYQSQNLSNNISNDDNNSTLTTQEPQTNLQQPQQQQQQPQRKLKRLACTCPNCRDGDNRNPGEKKKQHICHYPDCNKVYGKTSHLRAHLRWHSGKFLIHFSIYY